MTRLRFNRFQFVCQTQQPLALNDYSGSMLRGAFGHALKKRVCVTRMRDCPSCLLYRQCQYPKLFMPPAPRQPRLQKFSDIPPPYVIEPPAMGAKILDEGTCFSFQQVLMGPAIEQLPIVIMAWQQALKAGLGVNHAKVELLNVVFEPGQNLEQKIYPFGPERSLLSTPRFTPVIPDYASALTLQLQTPLRIQKKGKILANDMRGSDFVRALVRRYYLLQEFYGVDYQPPDFSRLAAQAETIQAEPRLRCCGMEPLFTPAKAKNDIFGCHGSNQTER